MYVALGDSMSIDDYAGGAGWGAASLLHRNRDADFPAWAGRREQVRLAGCPLDQVGCHQLHLASPLSRALPALPS